MTLCPVALVTGCKNCPVVALCPLKTVIGDYQKPQAPTSPADPVKPDGKGGQ
jgi:hypothetical protein